MSRELAPCSSCQRHVRVTERTCPFCCAARSVSFQVDELRLLNVWDRSRIAAFSAILSAAGIALGCRDATVSSSSESPSSTPPSRSAEAAPSASTAPLPLESVPAPPASVEYRGASAPIYGGPPRPVPSPKPKPSE